MLSRGFIDQLVGRAGPRGVGASRLRTLLVLLAATLLPLMIYALVSTSISYRDDRRATEAATLARAVKIVDAVDARLDGVSAMMRALATIRSIRERRWDEARQRSIEIAALDADWRDVSLIDLDTGTILYALRRTDLGDQQTGRNGRRANETASMPSVGGIIAGSDGRPELRVTMQIQAGSTSGYLLQVTLDPRLVQRILAASAPREGVSAVVDRSGLFIARSKAASSRLGTPATKYVQQAIRSGGSGIYRGVTYEGLENYSAFATSPRTGWSAHVAVSRELFDAPQTGWRLAAGLAGLMGIILAVALILLILRFVAARRAVEERAHHAERLESVGKLTGGIAHDFNNMLAIVIGSLDLAHRRLARGDSNVARYIDNAMDGAMRAAELTRRLLAFSRNHPLAPAAIDVNTLIRTTGELLRRTIGSSVEIEFDFEPEVWPTFVDPGQLENALVNLAVNARDAMPDGGRLTIATENRPGASGGKDHVVLTVIDTGFGMSREVASRAFEPFYTTKDVGRGTGLGLSQIHGFVTQSGGDVTIASMPGEGTSVTMLLPRHTGPEIPAGEAKKEANPTAPEGRLDEIVLIVEDEERVRRTTVEALRSLGYTVRHASNGREALTVLAGQPGVHIMITDIVMPGMNGRELAEHVRRDYPDIRILLATGYEREQVGADEDRVLRKPFGISELAQRVRRELDFAGT